MRVAIQVIGLVIMLFLGIFIGVNSAETSMQKIHGTDGAAKAIQIVPKDNGKLEISVMGQVVETDSPIPTEKVTEVTKTVKENSNHIASISNEVGNGLREVTRGALDMLFTLFR